MFKQVLLNLDKFKQVQSIEIGEIQRIRKWEIEKSIPIPKSQNKSNPDAEGGGLDLFWLEGRGMDLFNLIFLIFWISIP